MGKGEAVKRETGRDLKGRLNEGLRKLRECSAILTAGELAGVKACGSMLSVETEVGRAPGCLFHLLIIDSSERVLAGGAGWSGKVRGNTGWTRRDMI